MSASRSLGQFYPVASPLHGLDARAKILATAVLAVGTPERVFYAHLLTAPSTVRTASILRGPYPGVGRPVRFKDTLAALKGLLEGRG